MRFYHYGDVPGGVLDPEKMGTGVNGEDQKIFFQYENDLDIPRYASAVIDFRKYDEVRVQTKKLYTGTIPKDKILDVNSDSAAAFLILSQSGNYPAAVKSFLLQKKAKASGRHAVRYGNHLRILVKTKVNPA